MSDTANQSMNGGQAVAREVDVGQLRVRVARRFDIASEELADDTHFVDDLQIPPGELYEILAEIAEDYEVDLEGELVVTLGALRGRLQSG